MQGIKFRLMGVGLWLVVALLLPAGCSSTVPGSQPATTSLRSVDESPPDANVGLPAVKDFLGACDRMARDLVMTTVVQTAQRPLVIEIRPVENKTGKSMDLTIYPQTIRGMILKQGSPNIAFRDETVRKEIIRERAAQSDVPVIVEDSTEVSTVSSTRTLGGVGVPPPANVRKTSKWKTKKTSAVSGRIAAVDYFLNGFIYATTETSAGASQHGFRYHQFQFRLTDARSGLVVWENVYRMKREGNLGSAPGVR